MEPNETVRPIEEEQPLERMDRLEPAAPARPTEYRRYRRDVVQTDDVSPAARAAQVVYIIFGIVIALLVIRVILKALAANPGAAFTSFVYGITGPLVAPFQGIFATPTTTRGSVFEFSSVVAIVVYVLVAWGIVRLIEIMGQRRTTTTMT